MTHGRWNTLEVDETESRIATIAMNRPERRNAINGEMAQELEACLAGYADRSDVRVLILTGAGPAFGAGADLSERAGLDPEAVRRQRDCWLRSVERIESLTMPVIAMINGAAIAGSLELALACDIRVASERAVFALPELRSAGSFPGAGGPVRLARMVGRGRASLIVLSARRFSAAEAFDLGFVEQVVPHAELPARTLGLAREIAANSPAGVAAAKTLIRRSLDLSVADATRLSSELRDPQDGGADVAESLQAWQQGRTPQFSGPSSWRTR